MGCEAVYDKEGKLISITCHRRTSNSVSMSFLIDNKNDVCDEPSQHTINSARDLKKINHEQQYKSEHIRS